MKRDAFIPISFASAPPDTRPAYSRETVKQPAIDAAWLEHLGQLAGRHCPGGAGPDLGSMTLAELWGFYRFLSRVDFDEVAA